MPTSTATPTRERRGRTASGFTLLELVLTIGLLALVATVVVPRLTPGGRPLRLAADDAALRLTAARWQAVVGGRPVRVSLDTLAPGFRAVERDAAPGADAPSVTFDPVPAALPRTIELADAAGASARITIPSGLAPLAVSVGDPS